MKKTLSVLLVFFATAISASAEALTGTALSDFSTEHPEKHFSVKINEGFTVDNLVKYDDGTIFYGEVTKVVNGKIGKRKGYFVFTPTYYSTKEGVHQIARNNLRIKVSYYKPFDKDQAVKNLANTGLSTAASTLFHIPMLSQGVSFIKGVVTSDEDSNRLVSGVKSAYKSTPLTYVEKGEELHVLQGQEVKLNINEE